MATETATRSCITLKCSTELVKEFFYFGINSVLYQRGVFPSEQFKREKKYGMSLLVTNDDKLNRFLDPLLEQIKRWLAMRELRRVVVVISDVATKEPLERWQFDVALSDALVQSADAVKSKTEKQIRQEIADVLRQITASVSFLPLLESSCSFDVLIYTGKETDAPDGWAESGPCNIDSAQTVQLRSFSTGLHSVDSCVSYKSDD